MTTHRNITLLALVAFATVAAFGTGPTWAGDDGYKKCDVDTNGCVRMMVDKLSNRGWIGIEWDDQAETPVLTLIADDSPAERAGLKRGDHLLAFNAVLTSEGSEAVWAEAKKSLVPGKTITLTIERSGVKKAVDVLLVPVPRHIMAQWIGNHVLEHHLAEKGAKEGESEAQSP